MGIRLSKRILRCLGTAVILCAGMPCINAFASEEVYPVICGGEFDGNDPVLTLTQELEDYIVLPGDSLWKISEKLWGNGNYYVRLAEVNKDIITDPDLIYPDMSLKVSQTGYIVREEAKYGGAQMGNYSMDFPHSWKVGMTQSGNAFANFVLSGEGAIACLIQDKKSEILPAVNDWQHCSRKITDYAEKNFKAQVSDLNYEHYSMENQGDGSGELYIYSFIWHISPDYPSLTARVCVGLKLTEHIQAEFIGYTVDDYDICGCVRYVTASFEEHYEAEDNGEFTVNDSNMSILPDMEWELKGMFNAFAYTDEYFTSALNRILEVKEKKEDNAADKEDAEEWEKAFERLKQGDWSMVEIDSDMEYLRGLTGDEWCSRDINEDGIPELIGYFIPEYSNIKQIEVIFAYQNGKIKMVLADVNDGMEYYFLCENGNLIYDSESTNGYASFTQCIFDEKWERKDLHRLVLHRFLDSYPEEEDEYLKKLYPDTYGTGGGGFYFYSAEPKTEDERKNNQEDEYWTWSLISKEQFLASYEEMTGYNFLEVSLYWADFLDGTYDSEK